MQTSPTSSTTNSGALPVAATWKELSHTIDSAKLETFETQLEQSLEQLELELSSFITPRSLKKSLRSSR